MKTVYLALGSNMGDREQNIARAIESMEARGVRVVRQSSLYETEPVGIRGDGWFLNCAVQAQTDLMPLQLLNTLLQIEKELGRKRHEAPAAPHGLKDSRTIDLDILLFGDSVIHSRELEVPHPRMTERRFVLVPLAEIAGGVRHPLFSATISELLAGTADRSEVRPYNRERGAAQK
ncbi:MAG TPA: 2-amino-4-hydroxy-6-hydroxymethyldihydropteridine diphosphokinase [Candidatus Acidoferrales bacterium]|nr:2-amino-4-hydroxy-6-hydroxymethyldihydropteridine diphosphokinase [Candidatus Acidoferrales bacterium]